ncbi:MAG TPA: thiamine phosphate synthase [Pyrinomonadaceae bacterium]
MSDFKLPRVYPITDVSLSGLAHAEQVALLCEGGARLVQLREKRLSPREFYRQTEEAVRVAHACGARVVINDRADIALAAGADGVHLGQDDLTPEAARRLLGRAAIIGYSTHNVEQARAAAGMPVDYIAIGPVFDTASKERPHPVVGLDGVRRARAAVGSAPLVAIGGITRHNARAVIDAGADCVAVIGALLSPAKPSEIAQKTRELLALLRD